MGRTAEEAISKLAALARPSVQAWLQARREDPVGWLKEPSTIRGITAILGVVGLQVNPELLTSIVSAVWAIQAAVNIIRRESGHGISQ